MIYVIAVFIYLIMLIGRMSLKSLFKEVDKKPAPEGLGMILLGTGAGLCMIVIQIWLIAHGLMHLGLLV